MKLCCDLSVTTAPHHPQAIPKGWGRPWASPLSATLPELVLDFAAGVYGAGGGVKPLGVLLSLSRASQGSVIDANGLLVAVPPHAPRLAHDPATHARLGLLLEPARGNLLAQTATPSSQGVTVTASPHVLSFYGTGSITLSGAHNQTVIGTGAYPTRRVVSFTPSAGTLTLTLSGQIQAPQLEVGGFATSYIPATVPPALRADDNATVALGPWYSSTSGTLVFSGYVQGASANDRIIEIDDGSATTRLSLLWNTVLGKPQFQVWNAGALQAAIAPPGNAVPFGTEFRVAIGFGPDAFAISLNGGEVAADTSGTVPAGVSTLRLGRAAGGAQGSTITESLVYYPTRLSNAEVRALSA